MQSKFYTAYQTSTDLNKKTCRNSKRLFTSFLHETNIKTRAALRIPNCKAPQNPINGAKNTDQSQSNHHTVYVKTPRGSQRHKGYVNERKTWIHLEPSSEELLGLPVRGSVSHCRKRILCSWVISINDLDRVQNIRWRNKKVCRNSKRFFALFLNERNIKKRTALRIPDCDTMSNCLIFCRNN